MVYQLRYAIACIFLYRTSILLARIVLFPGPVAIILDTTYTKGMKRGRTLLAASISIIRLGYGIQSRVFVGSNSYCRGVHVARIIIAILSRISFDVGRVCLPSEQW